MLCYVMLCIYQKFINVFFLPSSPCSFFLASSLLMIKNELEKELNWNKYTNGFCFHFGLHVILRLYDGEC